MMKNIRDNLQKKKSERREFTLEEKRDIYDNIAHGKCAICKEKLKQKFEVDHIKPLASGGTNDIKNLQLLLHLDPGIRAYLLARHLSSTWFRYPAVFQVSISGGWIPGYRCIFYVRYQKLNIG